MNLPNLGRPDGTEAIEKTKQLIPWLPDPFKCPSCSVYCDATTVYDPHMYEPTKAWTCSQCETDYYRDGV